MVLCSDNPSYSYIFVPTWTWCSMVLYFIII